MNCDNKYIMWLSSLNKTTIEKIVASRYKYSVDEELEKLNNINAKFYTEDDEEYPEKLKYIPDAPLGIYVRGKIVPEDRVSVAIVGSRRITDYGAMCCKWSCDGYRCRSS